MQRRTWACVLLLAMACGPKSGEGGGGDDTTPKVEAQRKSTEALLQELHTAAGCGTPEKRVWCAAADGWATGTAAELPKGKALFVGVSVGLLDDEAVGEM